MQARLFALALAACHGPSARPSTAPTPAEPSPSRPTSPATRDDAGTMASLRALLSDPTRDPEGTTRARLAAELRAATDPAAVELLVEVLRQPPDKQPAIVHREAITSLGALRAASAVDAILLAIFTAPDAPTTSNMVERAKVAVASIGAAAVPKIVDMIEGRNADIARAVQDNAIPLDVVKQTGAMMLIAIRDPKGEQAVMRLLGSGACPSADAVTPVTAAHVLGRMGHAQAADRLCRCFARADDPVPGFVGAEALAFIGGTPATDCLVGLIGTAVWDSDAVATKEFVHELRWEAVRFAALAGGPTAVPRIRKQLARNDAAVRRRASEFEPMLDALERCGDDPACLDGLIADAAADPFAREAALFARARQAPQSVELALAASRLFAVADPDVRASAAVLALRLSPPRGCPACTQPIGDVLERERGSMPAQMQLAVISARLTIAAVGDDGTHVPFAMPTPAPPDRL